ncbi:YraN family protein [Pontibacter pamirensis]|uniref:YraN family protein n=1 Tax=Pontibacter pamirensis TaxID=2562824 RepID=UPI001389E14C|nr:YraN family protein [Pontibacter pamirensis]
MASQINAHILTGQAGENRAAAYLLQQGYTIVRRNFRHRRAEVDIIAQKENLLIFVEVKTRSTDRYGYPEEAVSAKKETMLLEAAQEFIYKIDWQHDIRFDIIAITLSTPVAIHHIEDAFY